MQKDRERAIIRFYNFFASKRVESINDVPLAILVKIDIYSLKELCIPFAAEAVFQGRGRQQISQRFGLPEYTSRGIRKKAIGHISPSKSKTPCKK